MNDQPEIRPGPLSAHLAAGLRRVRESKRLTYTELVKRLEDVGHPIPILGVRRIERGERRVDVDDLAALARALDVPPVALLFPLDTDEPVVEFPDTAASANDAMLWFIGEGPMPGATRHGWEADAAPVLLRHRHRRIVDWYESAERTAKRIAPDPAAYENMVFKLRATAVDELGTLRDEMGRHGLMLPALPAALEDSFLHRNPQREADRGPED